MSQEDLIIKLKEKKMEVFSKKDLINHIAEKKNITIKMATSFIDVFFNEINNALICGDRIELRGFGTMVVRKREGKKIVNPKTHITIDIPEKGFLYFRASKLLLKMFN